MNYVAIIIAIILLIIFVRPSREKYDSPKVDRAHYESVLAGERLDDNVNAPGVGVPEYDVDPNFEYRSPPTHMPMYTRFPIHGHLYTFADYTNTPPRWAKFWRERSLPGVKIFDGKVFPPLAAQYYPKWSPIMGPLRADIPAPVQFQKISPADIGRVNRHIEIAQKYPSVPLPDEDTPKYRAERAAERDRWGRLAKVLDAIEPDDSCGNIDPVGDCAKRFLRNECVGNPGYMYENCRGMCGLCNATPDDKKLLTDIALERPASDCGILL